MDEIIAKTIITIGLLLGITLVTIGFISSESFVGNSPILRKIRKGLAMLLFSEFLALVITSIIAIWKP